MACADPGPDPFHSELAREMPALMRLFKKLISRKVDNAAANILYYATQDLSENGSIFKGTRRQEKIPYWNNRRVREELWRKTEELLVN